MKLTVRDKIIVLVLALCGVIYCFYNYVFVPLEGRVGELNKAKAEVEGFASDITPLLEQSKTLETDRNRLRISVDNVRTLASGYTATNEEFLLFLGEKTEANKVAVTGFNELGIENKSGVYKTYFDFELRGNTVDINKVLEDIENMGIKYSIGSVSFRQDETYDYLKRFYDDMTTLQWYKEPEEDEEEAKAQSKEPAKEQAEEPPKTSTYTEPNRGTSSGGDTITVPEQAPVQTPVLNPTPTPTPESEKPEEKPDENINDRLDDLLKETAYSSQKYSFNYLVNQNKGYSISFLANDKQVEYKSGQDMRLAVTVCLIMFNEPSSETSFYNSAAKGEVDEIL